MRRFLNTEREAWRALRPMLTRHRRIGWGVIVLGVLSALSEGLGIGLFIPLLQYVSSTSADAPNMPTATLGQAMLDAIGPNYQLPAICGAILLTIALASGLTYGNRLLAFWLSARLAEDLRRDVFHRYLQRPYSDNERARPGQMINTLASETWRASSAARVLLELIVTLATLLVYVGLLLMISWSLTLVVAVCLLGISLLVRRITRRASILGRVSTRANAGLGNRMVEVLSGMKTIRAFGRENYERDRFEGESRRVRHSMFRLDAIAAAVEPVYELLAATLLVVIAFISLRDASNLPALLVFLFVLYRMQPRMKMLDHGRTHLASLNGAVREVGAALTLTPDPAHSGTLDYTPLRDTITLENVTFRYPSTATPALNDVSLTVAARKTTALVGPSGGGKTTLVKLLLRFYEPTDGRIWLDDRPLADIKIDAWRRHVALVSQDLFVFNETVRENIAYGQLDASEDQIIDAARMAQAHEFIQQLPQGYDTVVGDRGTRLSGGQQQRLTLARALVREPDLLILDEATNALDSRSEALIQQALDAVRHERTVLIIAHRLATVAQADHVVVLEHGRVIEQGPPSQLLRDEGLFAELYRLQQGDPVLR